MTAPSRRPSPAAQSTHHRTASERRPLVWRPSRSTAAINVAAFVADLAWLLVIVGGGLVVCAAITWGIMALIQAVWS